MAPYSMDLRTRVLGDCDAGIGPERGRREVSGESLVGESPGAAAPRDRPGRAAPTEGLKKQALVGQEDRLRALVDAQPDRTLAELREALQSSASLSSVWRALDQLQLTVKKPVHADEQRRPDVAADRR